MIIDKLIYILTALAILSVITEKLTQLVRSYPGYVKATSFLIIGGACIALFNSKDLLARSELLLIATVIAIVLFLFIGKLPFGGKKRLRVFANIEKKNINKAAQETEITMLSMLLGLVIAFFFNANLLEMVKVGSFQELGWHGDFPFDFSSFRFTGGTHHAILPVLCGFMLTGFFLGFGSKFFHDFLDFLMEVKNNRRIQNKHAPDVEARLLRLQLDQKGTLLANANGGQKERIKNEIEFLNGRLIDLLKTQNG
jgi:hypothetical protein